MNAGDSVRNFVAAFLSHVDKNKELPPVRRLMVTDRAYPFEDEPVSMCVADGPLSSVAWALVCWAASLAEVSVHLWRSTGRDGEVQVHVEGRLSSGVPVDVYGFVAFGAGVFPNLERGTFSVVPLSELLEWAKPIDGTGKGVVV
ncbi:hypothetical protein [Amycolatopsis minnesotensis]|uniref:Uncharacterized protein n=1 Tax=Amycolatopsis minnesotensis TaxID=337894 RepID=A0ABP5D753_9PSEU